MELYLIRHGKTPANEKHLYCGRTDVPLSEEGCAEAKKIRYPFQPPLVYVSPMLRARQTATLLFPKAEQLIVDGLQEMDFGTFEGRSAEEMREDADYRKWVESGCLLPCPGGEDIMGFAQRIRQTLYPLVQQALSRQEKELVIVSHGGSIMAAMASYAQPAQEYFHWYVENCSGYRARIREESWQKKPAFEQWELLLPRKAYAEA
ncbi:MAG: histidine phosphatase family protein [Bacillota bacterium]|nr:histidine phosphatase family protein [Bacillota bacterium]